MELLGDRVLILQLCTWDMIEEYAPLFVLPVCSASVQVQVGEATSSSFSACDCFVYCAHRELTKLGC